MISSDMLLYEPLSDHSAIQSDDNITPTATTRTTTRKAFIKMATTIQSSIEHGVGFLLLLMAIIVGLLTYAMDIIVDNIDKSFHSIYKHDSYSHFERFCIVTIYRLCLVLISVVLCVYVAPASGSGIPEIRAIMHGRIHLHKYFSLRMLLVKIISLATVISASFPLGREGPFIHISTIVGQQLNKRWFKKCSKRQVLSACICVGVSACFSAPIGGVLFAIEITCSYFRVAHYITNFFAAIVGYAMIEVFSSLQPTSLELFNSNLEAEPYHNDELIWYIIEGCIFGVIGSLYVYLNRKCEQLLSNYDIMEKYPVRYSMFIAFALCCCGYQFDFIHIPYRQTISDLFQPLSLSTSTLHATWTTCGDQQGILCMLLYSLYYFIGSFIMITIEVPCGVFAPLFASGAGFGRMFGYALKHIHLHSHHGVTYSIVGASSLVSGATQTISAAVITLELIGNMKITVPLLIASVVSAIISNIINESIYDSQLHMKQLPMLALKPKQAFKRRTIRQAMIDIQDEYVELCPSLNDVEDILREHVDIDVFPIVKRHDFKVLCGEINRHGLEKYMRNQRMSSLFDDEYDDDVNQNPMAVSITTSLSYVFRIFHALSQQKRIYIISRKELVGVLNESQLIQFEQQ